MVCAQTRPTLQPLRKEISDAEFNRHQVTRGLDQNQRKVIREYGQTFNCTLKKVQQFASILNEEGGYDRLYSLVSNHREYPHCALRAYLQQGISLAQLTTSCTLYAAVDQLIVNPKLIRSYVDTATSIIYHHIDSVAPVLNIPCTSYRIFENDSKKQKKSDFFLLKFFDLDPDGLSAFKRLMYEVEESEKWFSTIQVPLGSSHYWSGLYSRFEAINVVNYFHLVEDPDVVQRNYPGIPVRFWVIPSFTAMQKFFQIKYPKTAVAMVPVMGKCTVKMIETEMRVHQRIVSIGLPGVDVPEVADSQQAGLLGFLFHDFYHVGRCSEISRSDRDAIFWLIDRVLRPVIQKIPDVALKKIGKKMVYDLINGELHFKVSCKAPFGQLFPALDENLFYRKLLIQAMVHHSQFWLEHFQVSEVDLLNKERKLYRWLAGKFFNTLRQIGPEKRTIKDIYDLGICYLRGYKIKADPLLAAGYLQEAADGGYLPAQRLLGSLFGQGSESLRMNLPASIFYYQKAAAQKCKLSMRHLFHAYRTGRGVLPSMEKSLQYLKQCGAAGDLEALVEMGDYLMRGIEISASTQEAVQCYLTAFEKGYPKAGLGLGLYYFSVQDLKSAFFYFKAAADAGDVTASLKTGLCYQNGLGVRPSLSRAFTYFKVAADAGCSDSSFSVGACYEAGSGGVRSKELALLYYEKAAAKGCKDAPQAAARLKKYLKKQLPKEEEKTFVLQVFSSSSPLEALRKDPVYIQICKDYEWHKNEMDKVRVCWNQQLESDISMTKMNQLHLKWRQEQEASIIAMARAFFLIIKKASS